MHRLFFGFCGLLVVSCTSVPDSALTEGSTRTKKEDTLSIPLKSEQEPLIKRNPIRYLEESIKRCNRELSGYRAILVKQERVGGKLLPREKVQISFQEKPFSVRMDWLEGERFARKTAYVRGENDDQILVLGSSWRAIAGVVRRDPHGSDARTSARYPITEFGIKIGSERTLDAWKKAKERGDLDIQFLGTSTKPELGNRPCWVIKRVGYPQPEDDGITESTFWFDKETDLQVGSYLTGVEGKLIAYYYFRDLTMNPTFSPETFTPEGLRK